MSENEKSFVGRYVCYNAVDGGACWGRIKAEVKINTMAGEKEAFILEDRIVAYGCANLGMTVKVGAPGGGLPNRTMAMNPETGWLSDNVGLAVRHVKGDSLLRKDVINLERDIIDFDADMALENLSDEVIFMALLKDNVEDSLLGNKAIQLALQKHLGTDKLKVALKEELEKRIAKRSAEDGKQGTEGS